MMNIEEKKAIEYKNLNEVVDDVHVDFVLAYERYGSPDCGGFADYELEEFEADFGCNPFSYVCSYDFVIFELNGVLCVGSMDYCQMMHGSPVLTWTAFNELTPLDNVTRDGVRALLLDCLIDALHNDGFIIE